MTGSLFAFVFVSVCGGEETVCEISWQDLYESQGYLAGEIVAPDAQVCGEALKMQHAESTPKTVQVLVLDKPGVSSIRYAITGQIRYEGVDGISYLEMWNHFSNAGLATP
jgi:hypothetical protein